MLASELEFNIRLANVIRGWKADATIEDLRAEHAAGFPNLGGYTRSRDRKEIVEMLLNFQAVDEGAPSDSVTIIRGLLEYAVYDREKSDECIAAIAAAEAYLAQNT